VANGRTFDPPNIQQWTVNGQSGNDVFTLTGSVGNMTLNGGTGTND
jgi:hypothetical protein